MWIYFWDDGPWLVISCYWSRYFEEEFLLGFFFGLSSLCELVPCRRRNSAIMTYIGAKRRSVSRMSCCGIISPAEDSSWICTLSGSWEVRLFHMTHNTFQNSEEQKVIFFHSFYLDDRIQTAQHRFRFMWRDSQPGAPFVFSPSSCLHSDMFKWAMHAWLRSSREATWYKWGFLSPFFPAWRNLNEGSSLLLWDKMCLVVLQDYLWSECQQES